MSIVNVALMRSYLPATEGNHRGFYSWAGVNTAWVREGKNSGHVVPLCCPLATHKLSTLELGIEKKSWSVPCHDLG